MRYYLRARAWHLTENFLIRDDANNPIFEIRGKLFHIGDDLAIYDCYSQQELVHIKQQVVSLLPHYKIYRNGQQWASVHQRMSLLGERFKVKGENGMLFQIEGDIRNWNFSIKDNQGHRLGHVNFWMQAPTKNPLAPRGYVVDVDPGADAPFVIALAMVVEMVREHHMEKGFH